MTKGKHSAWQLPEASFRCADRWIQLTWELLGRGHPSNFYLERIAHSECHTAAAWFCTIGQGPLLALEQWIRHRATIASEETRQLAGKEGKKNPSLGTPLRKLSSQLLTSFLRQFDKGPYRRLDVAMLRNTEEGYEDNKPGPLWHTDHYDIPRSITETKKTLLEASANSGQRETKSLSEDTIALTSHLPSSSAAFRSPTSSSGGLDAAPQWSASPTSHVTLHQHQPCLLAHQNVPSGIQLPHPWAAWSWAAA